jgi:cell wall assembly regulator SMI1
VPTALRELYVDRALVTDGGFDYARGSGISSFEPLNEKCVLDTREQLGSDLVPFATSDCGDPIYLRPGPSEPDKVYVTYHDEDKTEVLADSVAEFLTKVRNANRPK